MPVHALHSRIAFPPVEQAEADGLLAVGGDLSPARLVHAYSLGIFPWYGPGSPILWWSPNPRMVLFPSELHVPRSLRKHLQRQTFTVTLNQAFDQVIAACARTERADGVGTWIVPEMECAYCLLHAAGMAHSVEVWQAGQLVGGLYGVALGRIFFGESMFHTRANASKVALVHLTRHLLERGYLMLDCQQATAHMRRFGAREIQRREFMAILNEGLALPDLVGHFSGAGHE
jgi:leucyl/phenylalanyl-tRNA---protein transferase